MAKKRITVAKNPSGKGYCVNYGGKKKSCHRTKSAANAAAKKLRTKKGK